MAIDISVHVNAYMGPSLFIACFMYEIRILCVLLGKVILHMSDHVSLCAHILLLAQVHTICNTNAHTHTRIYIYIYKQTHTHIHTHTHHLSLPRTCMYVCMQCIVL